MSQAQKRRFSVIFLVAAVAIAALTGFYFVSTATAADAKNKTDDAQAAEPQEEKEEKAPIPVRVATAAGGQVSSYVTATANLVPENEVKVLAEWEGRLAEVRTEEGDAVANGQVLAALDREDGEITVNKARVRASTAELAYQRARKLYDNELISPDELEKVTLDRDIAAQELAEAEWRLEKTLIRSPFKGLVTGRVAQPGQHVRPGEEMFTVADFEPLVARIYLPEKDVLALAAGRSVRITLKADENVSFAGRIRQISPVVDPATGTVKVTVEATAPPATVRPGAFVRVDVVRETRQAAVLVPREAVVRELQKAYVFVADDGVAAKRAVTLGLEEDGNVEALSGLETGEQVIVAGQGGLKDGSVVKVTG